MATSSIEWTEMTWNPTTETRPARCAADEAMGVEKYKDNFKLRIHESELDTPYTWKKPKVVFVNSMSDLFHKDVPIAFIQKVFKVMKENPQHVFQVLTKRADVLRYYDSEGWLEWTHNIWMGVSVEDKRVMRRVDLLRGTGARVKFLSCEPLIGPLPDMDLTGIDWVIVGGESGRKPRRMDPDWVLDIKDQCERADVAFFFKQWGGTNKKAAGRELEGRTYDEMPELAHMI